MTNGAERMRIDSSGNVGIGTSSPNAKLTSATTSGNTAVSIIDTSLTVTGAETNYLSFFGTNNSGLLLTTPLAQIGAVSQNGSFQQGALVFHTTPFNGSSTERLRIDSSGNLLVGTTSLPSSSVQGVKISNPVLGACLFSSGAITSTVNQLAFVNGNGTVGTITTNGSATAYNTSSDYRLKDVDGPITNSGAYIDALNPVQGSWKADGSRFIGLIAHEVQEVSETPIATGEKDGEEMQAMDYSAPELIANLIAEIQSLRARVAQLEGA